MSTVLLAYSNSLSFLPVALILRVFLGGGGGRIACPEEVRVGGRKRRKSGTVRGEGRIITPLKGRLKKMVMMLSLMARPFCISGRRFKGIR